MNAFCDIQLSTGWRLGWTSRLCGLRVVGRPGEEEKEEDDDDDDVRKRRREEDGERQRGSRRNVHI